MRDKMHENAKTRGPSTRFRGAPYYYSVLRPEGPKAVVGLAKASWKLDTDWRTSGVKQQTDQGSRRGGLLVSG
ncbi:hypothetical protein E4U57_003165 [Claviceps arundinis]|uniref:Uncharacterized protein n=1 Tax=Claviceps arundinis TaxID=1623583 RepID=A0ABQ7PJW0_9HYPO|nr:hypothetical protein E4U57_003165 [Claviceps arundinis]